MMDTPEKDFSFCRRALACCNTSKEEWRLIDCDYRRPAEACSFKLPSAVEQRRDIVQRTTGAATPNEEVVG